MPTSIPKAPVRVLVVDDLPSIHDDYRKILEPAAASLVDDDAAAIFGAPAAPAPSTASAGAPGMLTFNVTSAYQGEEALRLVETALALDDPFAVAFVDMRMPPGWDGVETVQRLWRADPRLQVVICTAYSDYSWSDTVKALGHSDNLIILKKPFDHIEVQQLSHALARKWLLARQVEEKIAGLDEVVRTRTQELRSAEDGFAAAFDASPLAQAIITHDNFQVLAVNAAFEKSWGISRQDMAGISPEKFGRGLDATRWRGLMTRLSAGESIDDHPFVYEPTPHVRREMRASARVLQLHGRLCSVWVIRDVTERMRLEEQARQSQKMDAIGQLAAGVAHDFNNLITAVYGFTAEALDENQDDNLRPLLEGVQTSAVRAAALTRQLLVFSRKQATEVKTLDISKVVRDLKPMLRRLVPESIELVWDLPETTPPILADVANVEQIVLNLVLNARDALPANGGRIHVHVAPREFATAQETGHIDGRAGNFVVIEVTDNGSGIKPEVLPHIFEPFFTTKGVGKGTGLGLSTVYSVVRQHHGWIDVESTVGHGTTFTIVQPVAVAAEVKPVVVARPDAFELAETGRRIGRVLAVEDDPSVQSVLRLLFDRHGIESVIASDGASALKIWEERGGRFDLLLTDVVMPNGCTGIELARALRTEKPDLRVVIMTGYSAELLQPERMVMPGKTPQVMFKPFELAELLRVLSEA